MNISWKVVKKILIEVGLPLAGLTIEILQHVLGDRSSEDELRKVIRDEIAKDHASRRKKTKYVEIKN